MSPQNPPLHIEERGSGPAVVLLHGMPSDPADFDLLVARLAPERRVLVPHSPGYGSTPPDPMPGTLEQLAIRVERQLLDAGITQADLVAFSGGAYTAVSIALRARVVVPRLALLAPLVGLDDAAAQGCRALAAAARSGAFDPRPSWLERMVAPGAVARDPAVAARVLAWLDAAPLSVLCDELDATAGAADLRPRLSELTCSTLICGGTLDNAVPFASVEDIARKLRNGVLERLDGVGHALFVEEPERVFGLVAEFLGIHDHGEGVKSP